MKIIDYFRETKAEMKHVSWPTRQQAIFYTVIVIAISLVTGAILGLFDYLASFVIEFLIQENNEQSEHIFLYPTQYICEPKSGRKYKPKGLYCTGW